MKRNQSGQSLIEFLISIPVLCAAVFASVTLFRSEWNRVQCVRSAFFAAHHALRSDGLPSFGNPFSSIHVTVERTETGAVAHARCGQTDEVVGLPELERAQW